MSFFSQFTRGEDPSKRMANTIAVHVDDEGRLRIEYFTDWAIDLTDGIGREVALEVARGWDIENDAVRKEVFRLVAKALMNAASEGEDTVDYLPF
jgi:hypothetical protein